MLFCHYLSFIFQKALYECFLLEHTKVYILRLMIYFRVERLPFIRKMTENNIMKFNSDEAKEILNRKLRFEFEEGATDFEVVGEGYEKKELKSKKGELYIIYEIKIKVNGVEHYVSLWEAQFRTILKGLDIGKTKFMANRKGTRTDITIKNN